MGTSSSKKSSSKTLTEPPQRPLSPPPVLAQLVINGVYYDVGSDFVMESSPLQYSLKPINDVRIKWEPSQEISKLITRSRNPARWKIKIPRVLTTIAGEPITCVLMRNGKKIHDYGSEVYVKRASGYSPGYWYYQEFYENEFYVGERMNEFGFSTRGVCFYYDRYTGTLILRHAAYSGNSIYLDS